MKRLLTALDGSVAAVFGFLADRQGRVNREAGAPFTRHADEIDNADPAEE